jgi:iron complex transport system substrate-binding protein
MPERFRALRNTLVLMGLVGVGSLKSALAVTVLDDLQQEVRLAQVPQRIVSLLPSLTETVCALGQCHK